MFKQKGIMLYPFVNNKLITIIKFNQKKCSRNNFLIYLKRIIMEIWKKRKILPQKSLPLNISTSLSLQNVFMRNVYIKYYERIACTD